MSSLVGLEKVKWDKLETIEGSAGEAPIVLNWLASGDAKKASKAVGWLFEEVLHQSTPAPSAATFVPFLIQLVALDKQPARWELLALLGELACGGDHRSFITGGDPASVDAKLHAAVARGHATYLSALENREWKVRSAAAFSLAWLPKQGAKTLKALLASVTDEEHATARASMLLAIAVLEGKKDFSAAKSALTKLKSGDVLCWENGNVKALVSRISYVAGAAPADIDALIKTAVSNTPASELVAIVKMLFPKRIDPKKLTADQRKFLDALTSVPQRFGLLQLMRLWEERDLPVKANDARAKLGMTIQQRESPLDQAITVDGKTKSFAEHLADAVKTPAKRKPLAIALAKTHKPEQIIDLCCRSLQLWLRGQDKDKSLSRARVYAALFEAFGEKVVPILRTYPFPDAMSGPDGDSFLTGSIALPIFNVLARLDEKPPANRLQYLLQRIPLTIEFDKVANMPLLVEGLLALSPKLRKPLVEHLERNAFSLETDEFKAKFRLQLGL